MDEWWRDWLVVDLFLQGGGRDDAAAAAWERLRPTLMGGMANPPGAMGAAWRGAAGVANQLYGMGLADGEMLPDSVGMERLLLRWVVATEAMAALFSDVLAQSGRATAQGTGRTADFDLRMWLDGFEEYQVSYCDDCGAELFPGGYCPGCGQGLATDVQDEDAI